MTNYKARIDRIRARLDIGTDQEPRTFADFIVWETDHMEANGGELTPAESAYIETTFRRFMESGRRDRIGGRPHGPAGGVA